MKLLAAALVGCLLLATPSAAKAQEPQPRVVELKAPDGRTQSNRDAHRAPACGGVRGR